MLEHVEERDHVERTRLDGSFFERASDPGDVRRGRGDARDRVLRRFERAHLIPGFMGRASERALSCLLYTSRCV